MTSGDLRPSGVWALQSDSGWLSEAKSPDVSNAGFLLILTEPASMSNPNYHKLIEFD